MDSEAWVFRGGGLGLLGECCAQVGATRRSLSVGTLLGPVFLFFPVNLKSAREPRFSEDVHGHIFAFTGTLFRRFTGKWLRSRAHFWTFSRALFRSSRA